MTAYGEPCASRGARTVREGASTRRLPHDLSIELNPDTEQVKNVQGEISFVNNGYTPSMSNDSYIARREDAIYPHLQTIVDTLATDDKRTSATMMVATLTEEVKESTTKTLTGKGYTVPVKVVCDSDGGGTAGYAIPFTVSEDGGRTQGTVSVSNKAPTFTPEGGTSPTALSEPAQTKSTSKSNLS